MKRLLAVFLVLSLAALACGITVRATSPQAVLQEYLEGRTIVIFGDEQFITNAKDDVEVVGMIVLTAPDLQGAIGLAGEQEGPYEFHCVDQSDTEMVVAVQEGGPDRILFNGTPIVDCPQGAILVGFLTDENPDVTVIK